MLTGTAFHDLPDRLHVFGQLLDQLQAQLQADENDRFENEPASVTVSSPPVESGPAEPCKCAQADAELVDVAEQVRAAILGALESRRDELEGQVALLAMEKEQWLQERRLVEERLEAAERTLVGLREELADQAQRRDQEQAGRLEQQSQFSRWKALHGEWVGQRHKLEQQLQETVGCREADEKRRAGLRKRQRAQEEREAEWRAERTRGEALQHEAERRAQEERQRREAAEERAVKAELRVAEEEQRAEEARAVARAMREANAELAAEREGREEEQRDEERLRAMQEQLEQCRGELEERVRQQREEEATESTAEQLRALLG